nr:kinesin-like protein KIN-7C, mitochondrial isoform X1 [Ipomoea batatas]
MIDDDIGSINSEVSAYDRVDVSDLDELVKDYKRNRRRGLLGCFKLKVKFSLSLSFLCSWCSNEKQIILLLGSGAKLLSHIHICRLSSMREVPAKVVEQISKRKFNIGQTKGYARAHSPSPSKWNKLHILPPSHVLHYPIIVSNTKPLRFKALGVVFPVLGVPVNRPGINEYFGFGGTSVPSHHFLGFCLSLSSLLSAQLVPSPPLLDFLAFLTWPIRLLMLSFDVVGCDREVKATLFLESKKHINYIFVAKSVDLALLSMLLDDLIKYLISSTAKLPQCGLHPRFPAGWRRRRHGFSELVSPPGEWISPRRKSPPAGDALCRHVSELNLLEHDWVVLSLPDGGYFL